VKFLQTNFPLSQTETGCMGTVPCTEPVPELQALVSAMTAGPVAPADKIGMFNAVNIMATTRADGVLIKPDVPATPLDIIFKSTFSDKKFLLDTLSHTYSTHSATFSFSGNFDTSADNSVGNSFINSKAASISWHYLLVANTDRQYTILPSDLGNSDTGNYFIFNYFAGATKTISPFNSQKPLMAPILPHKGTSANYLYYVIAPSLSVNGLGYTLLGETSKFITASAQRITLISVDSSAGSVTLTVGFSGVPQEIVHFEVLSSANVVESYKCTIPKDSTGDGKLVCVDDGKQRSCSCV